MFAQKGQVLLIVILVIIVSSTIGLSVASRSIISLRTSTEEAESQKALSAAEAGIERAIQGSIPIAIRDNNPSNNSSYSTSIDEIKNSASFIINGGSEVLNALGQVIGTIPNTVPKDEGADVWFVGRSNDGTPDYASPPSPQFLTLYWGGDAEACDTSTSPAAIQAIVVSRSSPTDIRTYRYAYDPCSRDNNFTSPDAGNYTIAGAPGVTFKYKTPTNHLARTARDIVLMRVIPIYKDSVIGVGACNPAGNNCHTLPSQGYLVTSTGISGSANRKITVFKGYQQTYLPYLSYGLFVAN